MADTLFEMWDDAKDTFETATGKKKPKDSKGVLNAFGSHTGLSGALEKFDKAEAAATKTNSDTDSDCKKGLKLAAEMEAQLAAFRKASASYAQVLNKAIDAAMDDRTEVDAKTVHEKALKFLQKQLAAVEATGASRAASSRQRFDAAEKNLGVKQKMLLGWQKNMTAVVARAAADVAKVKANPSVATYNSIFPKAARDVTMQLVFAKDIPGLQIDPAVLLKTMNPWASQGGNPPATLPDTATPEQVKGFLSAFSAELKKAVFLLHTKT